MRQPTLPSPPSETIPSYVTSCMFLHLLCWVFVDRDSTLHPGSVLVTEMVANAVAVSRLFFLFVCVFFLSHTALHADPWKTGGHIHPMQNCCQNNLPKLLISPRYADRRCFPPLCVRACVYVYVFVGITMVCLVSHSQGRLY